MNKYRDKSDFEINKAVAVNINGAEAVVEKFGIIYINDEDRSAMVSFSPCNNPADAMPIVIENGISLIFDTGCKAWVAGIAYWVDGCEWQISHEVERMNQYRAAMELFLMMKDAENETNT